MTQTIKNLVLTAFQLLEELWPLLQAVVTPLLKQAESGLLKLMEGLPYITGRSLEEPGSVSDGIFNAQKGLFGGLAKGMGDARAEDRTGRLLRRVEMVNCGLL